MRFDLEYFYNSAYQKNKLLLKASIKDFYNCPYYVNIICNVRKNSVYGIKRVFFFFFGRREGMEECRCTRIKNTRDVRGVVVERRQTRIVSRCLINTA
jgi:hypothetical protein